MATAQPCPSSPRVRSSGTRTPSKKTSENSGAPCIVSIGRTSIPALSMSTNRAVMPRCAESASPVRVSSTQRWAYWARLVQTFWPVTRQPPSVGVARHDERGQVAPRPGLREALAPRLVAPQEPRHHGGGEIGRGVVDHRRRQDLGHGVDAGLDQAPEGEGLAEIGPQQARPAQAAHPLGPSPAHVACVVGQSLDLGQLRHLVVERLGAPVLGLEDVLVLVEPVVERRSELVELHQSGGGEGDGRVGSCGRPASRAPLLRRNVIDRERSRQPSPVRR